MKCSRIAHIVVVGVSAKVDWNNSVNVSMLVEFNMNIGTHHDVSTF